MVTYTDVGAGFNQLLDVTVLAVIAAGHLAGRLRNLETATAPLSLVLALAVVWGAGTGTVLTQVPDFRATVQRSPLGYPLHSLTALIRPGTGGLVGGSLRPPVHGAQARRPRPVHVAAA
jgi:hypothetical protein